MRTFWNLLSTELNRMCSIYAMNGKSVEIDNTDAEGRLILSGETLLVPCLLQD
jgi:leucyl aminopeptidase